MVEAVEEHLGQVIHDLPLTLGKLAKLVGYKVGDSLEGRRREGGKGGGEERREEEGREAEKGAGRKGEEKGEGEEGEREEGERGEHVKEEAEERGCTYTYTIP